MAEGFLDTPQKRLTLLSVCMISFIMLGMGRSFGVFFAVSLARYGSTRAMASIPFVLSLAVRSLMSPVVGYLGGKFGLKTMIIFGAVLAAVSFSASFLAEDVTFLIISIGVVFGFSHSLCTLLLHQALTYHFQKHLDKANGFYFATGFTGGIIMTASSYSLLNVYGLSGIFLIYGGLILHVVPAALLLKKPEARKELIDTSKTSQEGKVKTNISVISISADNAKKATHCSHDVGTENIATSHFECNVVVPLQKNSASSINCEVEPKNIPTKGTFEGNSTSIKKLKPPLVGELEQVKQSPSRLFLVFLDPVYVWMNITQSFCLFMFGNLLIVMVDVTVDNGLTLDEGIQCFNGLSVGQVVGSLFLGVFTDKGWITKVNFVTLQMCLTGAMLMVFTLLRGYFVTMLAVISIGVLNGGVYSIGVGIISMYVEKKNVRMATASRFFLYAPMGIFQPFIVGYFRDTLKSYNGLFYTFACLSLALAVMFYVTPTMARLRDSRKIKKEKHIESIT